MKLLKVKNRVITIMKNIGKEYPNKPKIHLEKITIRNASSPAI